MVLLVNLCAHRRLLALSAALLFLQPVVTNTVSAQEPSDAPFEITNLDFLRIRAESDRSAIYLTVKTKSGHEGLYGPIDYEAALIADKMLKKHVIGKNALGHEAIWNDLFKANRHSGAAII